MARLLKLLVFLVIVAGVAVVGYGLFGDMSPRQQERAVPLKLELE